MRSHFALVAALAAPLFLPACTSTGGAAAPVLAKPTIGHDVFFQLKDLSQVDGLIAACEALRAIPGVVHVTAGPRDESQQREVNEDWFHVSLHVEFATSEDYDGYGPHPIHQELLAKFGEGFERVAVYDSFINGAR